MSTLFEIVELPCGDIVLRRAEEDKAPLVSISFSEEAIYFLKKNKFLVAKAMIEAGLDVASDSDSERDGDGEIFENGNPDESGASVLH